MSENFKIWATGVSSVDVCTFMFSIQGNSTLKPSAFFSYHQV